MRLPRGIREWLYRVMLGERLPPDPPRAYTRVLNPLQGHARELWEIDQRLPVRVRPRPVARKDGGAMRCYRVRPDGDQCGLLIYERTDNGERYCYEHGEVRARW